MNQKSESLINHIFFDKYKVIRKIGQGSFGRIYICQDIISNEYYAMKVEQNSFLNSILESESKYLNYLKGFGIPELIFFGRSEKYFILIETLLGKSLENLYSESHGNFNTKDICMIGIQILDRLEFIHNKNFIHRDIKPDNFVIGKNEDKNTIYMIDFGLAKRYRNPLTQEHIPFRMTKRLTGTARYASVNALKGGEQSRKDDLESLNYMLLYFLKGSLPWQGVAGITKGEKYKKIYHIKKNIGVEKLYENLPDKFKELYTYIKKLEFEQDPDYDYCRKLLIDVIENNCGENYDNFFTWCKEINIANKNNFFFDIVNKGSNNNDESGKTLKSTKIINVCNSNILFDKINNKKIKKISVTFIDKRNKTKNKIMNCAYNFNQDIKKNKSLLLDNIYNIYDFEDNENSKKTKNKEIIVTDSDNKNNNDASNEDYSIEGEVEKKAKNNGKKETSKNKANSKNNNKVNILSLTKINQKKVNDLLNNNNRYKKNLNRIKTSRDFYFSKKHLNYIVNSQICNQTARNGYFKNKAKESHSKSSNKVKSKSKCKINYSKIFNENFNNSPNKIKKSKNKIFSMYNTHTNIRTKQKNKIKYSSNLQIKTKNNNIDKSNYKYSILLEDFINRKKSNSKKKYDTSKSSIKNYFRNMHVHKVNKNEFKDNSIHSNNKYAKSTSTSKNKDVNSLSKINKSGKYHSISNKQLKIQQIFVTHKNKRNIIINVNKFTNKRTSRSNSKNKNSKSKKSESYISRMHNKKKIKKESRNNTINIESIIFCGDNTNQSSKNLSKSRNKSKTKTIIFTPKNMFRKNDLKDEKSNFLNKFNINILCNKKKYKTNNNSIKNIITTKIKKKGTKKKISNYHNISLKLSENKFKIGKRNTNIYNFKNKKTGQISFNNILSNVRAKKKINMSNNIFYNNSLMDKKIFIQNSFNSSDNNYILNNINNNNIIVNNYNNCNNNNFLNKNNKKFMNSFTFNNKNIFPDEINENNSNINIGGIPNNSNSIFKEIFFKNNSIKKKENSRQNIMKFIKKFHKNNFQKSRIKK